MTGITERVRSAREAGSRLADTDSVLRNGALEAIARAIEERRAEIDAGNQADLERAQRENLAQPLYKRLVFDRAKQDQAIAGLRAVARLEDPISRVLDRRELDDGLILTRRTTPIGVIAMIFESRPDALIQIASLALKSGNALVLKGGSEAAESNRVLARIVSEASVAAGAPEGWLQLVETREDVRSLLALDEYIDLMIPRGSNEFVRFIMDNTRIPVLGHADGICHVYLDRDADLDRAVSITVDSKTQYVAVCNAAETLLVHRAAAERLLPAVAEALAARSVALRGDGESRAIVRTMEAATDDDWATEYLDLVLSVRVVEDMDAAIAHINRYGSGHTDAIVTENTEAGERFLTRVDSASVMWNTSTRFADGFRYGLGAEVGISTARIHSRGPVGLDGLMSYKWIVRGQGHIVAEYGDGGRRFTHRDLPLD